MRVIVILGILIVVLALAARDKPSSAQSPKPSPSITTAAVAQTKPLTTFGERDFAAIVDASRNNELRFERDYENQLFATVRQFDGARKASFGLSDDYAVRFVRPGRSGSGEVICFLSPSNPALAELIDWRKGQVANVKGTISTTVFGALQLKDCTITPARQ